jgi:hypothetical protein
MSVPFASDAQALRLVDTPIGCCTAISSPAAPPYPDARSNGYTNAPLAYATPGDDVVARPENAITIKAARPFEAPTQVRLYHFLQPYEVLKQVDRHAVQSRIKQVGPDKKQPARRAPPPPKDIGMTFAALPPPADAARLDNRTVVEGRNLEIVSADEVNRIDLAADPRASGRAKSMTASQIVSPQALSVITGALAGAAVGLFLIFYSRALETD